jgi:hypothetical protein
MSQNFHSNTYWPKHLRLILLTIFLHPSSLMSVGKLSDNGTISIFTKDGVTVHKEQDVLITCQGDPILIGIQDERMDAIGSRSCNNEASGNRTNHKPSNKRA